MYSHRAQPPILAVHPLLAAGWGGCTSVSTVGEQLRSSIDCCVVFNLAVHDLRCVTAGLIVAVGVGVAVTIAVDVGLGLDICVGTAGGESRGGWWRQEVSDLSWSYVVVSSRSVASRCRSVFSR